MPFIKDFAENAGPPNLFKQYPDVYRPWAEMSEAMMNGPSPFSRGVRELILAYAAAVADCEFVSCAHAEVAYAHGLKTGLMDELLAGIDTADIEPELKPVFEYVKVLSKSPELVSQAHVSAILNAGWDADAVHSTALITARAAFMQRLVQGHGFNTPDPEVAKSHAAKRVERGYVNLYKAFRPEGEAK
ncbi:carboxymuconolactone decarboxylase family protein [Alteromonas lipolytica]|uniref:Peroxidase n=1 Tax=Alteromonas lipolytica TaxID=1856405 RepID=A0A1E8FI98_9ALTE|nr:hypothetical protein [Alteromonas lipolytica]OFI35655.1 hypothetical protein BFC17_12945 [Alteromonas lipolytica]GGF77948.1 hypothetical protein GCM10011338_32910 [Alteromonas lipolytica]